MSNGIANPFHRGQSITVPAGTLVRSMNPRHKGLRTLTARQRVRVHMVSGGWIDTAGDEKRGRGYVILPTITWPGGGGYWQDVQVTAELLAANDLPPLTLPQVDAYDAQFLDAIPSLDPGYTNQWATPAAEN